MALCHRSWCAENPGETSNERLEFLGDAVLGLVVTDHIYGTYDDQPEGEMAKVRAAVVNSEVLAELAGGCDLGAAVL
ncbi:MAG TPA: ribonuclease III domain-containing protein, partial [Acidimicrobiales bacterium]|nr:ribonuclease III domain-containing protein [Acidimicrobiales bacterium]